MGVYVRLRVLVNRIDPEQWSRLYGETLRVLEAWPDRPLGLQWRAVGRVEIPAYSRCYETEEGWKVVGDQKSRLCGESFEFPKRLAAPSRPSSTVAHEERTESVLAALAQSESGSGCGLAYIFDEKTQGRPYHELLVAVGALVENRLPGIAVTYSDLCARDGARACQLLRRTFGERFSLPILLDEKRLRAGVPQQLADHLLAHYGPPQIPA